jgi:hypothetical protein
MSFWPLEGRPNQSQQYFSVTAQIPSNPLPKLKYFEGYENDE